MDLLASVDPLMGGVFQNSHGGVGHPSLAEQSVHQYACVCVWSGDVCVCTVGFLAIYLQGLPQCLNYGINLIEKCYLIFFHSNLRKLFFCLLVYLKLIVMKSKQESDEDLLTVTTGF